ncbi:MAG: hypothetical protein MR019_02565 [Ruminococcus sp.]|nr:hypothetical protein [Ruminococcus sp.]MDY3895005.1 hypothetical protein [Candidatus Fimenecus sp.]
MSIITKLDRHTGLSETTLNGVVNSEATYEIIDGILIIRTTTNDTIHITRNIGKKLVDIINSELI